jgi:uncharacterized protein YdeI (YjbR/CyaY-like superfamily)
MADERVYVADRDALRAWLSEHHGDEHGVWIVYDKGQGRSLRYDDIVDEAVCFGLIDSLPRSLSDEQAMLRVAPRRPKSSWSKRNKERVERLLAQGLMQPSGLIAVEAAKRNGAWSAIDAVEELREPDDLAAALDATPRAREFWDAFPRSTKRAILEWIEAAKRPQTRAARIRTTADEASANRRANQWRQPKSAGGA